MPERPLNDPPTDSRTTLAEAERDTALRRFEALRPHIQDGRCPDRGSHSSGCSGAFVQIQSAFAEMERNLLRQRVLEGVKAARARGRTPPTS